MINWFEGDIDANGITVHYHRSGTPGQPPLLLLHGVTDSGRVWSRVAGELRGEYDIVMTDARGHGQSADLSNGFSLDLLAADAAGVITGLGLQQPYVWGHSMGAITAAILAGNYPDLVRAAVLEDPPFFSPEGRRKFAEARRAAAEQPQAFPDFRAMSDEERLATARAMNPRWHAAELPAWAESKAQFDPTIGQQIEPVADYPWREAVARITCPTLLLTADPAQGAIVTPEIAQEATALMRQGQFAQMPGAGHNIHREAYEQTIQVVREFLQAHGDLLPSPQR